MNAEPILKYTAEEYLELEETSLEKNEFYKGEIFAMAGASIPHNQIVRNTMVNIGKFLEDKKCQIFPSDLRIHSIANSLYTYPDLSIICNEIETAGKRKNTVTNPTVLIEVLSKTTQDYDRGAKFKLYRDIESLKEYILISSLETLVEKYDKQADGSWVLHEYKSETDTFTITSIELLVTVKDLYRNVDFENVENTA
jgi:Uma2 family endonuclease